MEHIETRDGRSVLNGVNVRNSAGKSDPPPSKLARTSSGKQREQVETALPDELTTCHRTFPCRTESIRLILPGFTPSALLFFQHEITNQPHHTQKITSSTWSFRQTKKKCWVVPGGFYKVFGVVGSEPIPSSCIYQKSKSALVQRAKRNVRYPDTDQPP